MRSDKIKKGLERVPHRALLFLNIFFYLSLLMGCSSTGLVNQPTLKYESSSQSFFKDLTENYKLAYQTKPFSICFYRDKFERIDIILSNFDGSNRKNITESISPEENVSFVYPVWSPDGEWLAFAGVKYLTEHLEGKGNLYTTHIYIDIYITDKNNQYFKKIYSYETQLGAGIYFQCNLRVVWSKDTKKLIVWIPEVSSFWKKRGWGITPILVSLDASISPQEFLGDNFNDFVYFFNQDAFIRGKFISPNGKHEIILTFQRPISITPGIPEYMVQGGYWPGLWIGGNNIYLKDKTRGKKIRIFKGASRFLWTKDGNYIILYYKDSNFFIVNLKGESVLVKGINPDVQYGVCPYEQINY